jgi:hypothetical protein
MSFSGYYPLALLGCIGPLLGAALLLVVPPAAKQD